MRKWQQASNTHKPTNRRKKVHANMTIPEKLKTARRSLGLTQHQLARACSVTYRTVQHWEAGTRHVPVHKLRIVAFILGLTIDELVP